MFHSQGVETWMSVRKVKISVERTQIASTPMVAIIVSAKLDLKEIHVRFFDSNQSYFLRFISSPTDTECKDIDECRHLVQPCQAEESCVNLFYKDGIGFRCVPKNQTFAAVAIGGLDWNTEVDVLTAELNRCDGMIPIPYYPRFKTSYINYHKVI